MQTILIVLLLMLLAFAGMALGLLMGRRGLRGGCGGVNYDSACARSKCSCSGAPGHTDNVKNSSDNNGIL